ncbi:alpha/beta hydrolase [Sulfitobacter sp. HNIBRBA3233]|uniref:alpha/beta fold hydrolase n=1 Tax=Sulfitobacter marinivivus TaxID=3158558 RepID=UPI0032DE92E5
MPRFTTSDGLDLYYEDDKADGIPILCLAGLTRTTEDFDYVTPHLAGCRVIKMDYRGRGQSDFDPDWKNYILPVECRDVLELLAHLDLDKVAILGTSRGGLNAMGLAAGAKDRLLGVALNDVGPVIEPGFVAFLKEYIGRNPASRTIEEAAAAMRHVFVGFDDVPDERWLAEARKQYRQTDAGLEITYDPHLRDATLAMADQEIDLWPYFDALDGLPLALIWGENSALLAEGTVKLMQDRHPDMITARVPGRGHVPFLDEPQAVAALHDWIEAMK